MKLKGIDVSTWQGKIDWKKVKEDGIDFAIIRLGYGKGTKDKYFDVNVKGCEENGIKWGAYLYSYALTPSDAKKEADFVIKTLKGKTPTFPIAFDMEDADGYKKRNGNPSNSMLVRICDVFLQRVEDAGYYVLLYANLHWLNTKLNSPILDRYDKWLAQWSKSPTYNGKFSIWQYTSKGKVAGIKGNVDMNIAYTDFKFNSKPNKPTTPEPIKKGDYHKVVAGDTLSGIAKKYGTTVSKLMEINPHIKNKNLIYVGDKVYLDKVNNAGSEKFHKVKSGETLSGIAKKYGTTVNKLMKMNKHIKDKNLIYAGDTIKVGE